MSNDALIAQLKALEDGTTISFRSKNLNDTVLWRGVLESVGSYRSVRSYGDPTAYNEAVRQVDNTVPDDITALHYILITIDNNATPATTQRFAIEWISPDSLVIESLSTQVTVTVEDPNNNAQAIADLLTLSKYKILSITSTTPT